MFVSFLIIFGLLSFDQLVILMPPILLIYAFWYLYFLHREPIITHSIGWAQFPGRNRHTCLPFFDQPDGRVFLIEKKKSILPIQRGIATVNHCQQRWLDTRQSLAEFTDNLINHSTRETQAKRPKTIRLIFSLRNFTFIKKTFITISDEADFQNIITPDTRHQHL